MFCYGRGVHAFAESMPADERLNLETKRALVSESLQHRSSLDELSNKGIFQVRYARENGVRCVCDILNEARRREAGHDVR